MLLSGLLLLALIALFAPSGTSVQASSANTALSHCRIFGVGLPGSGTLALHHAIRELVLDDHTLIYEDNALAPFMYDDGSFNMSGDYGICTAYSSCD